MKKIFSLFAVVFMAMGMFAADYVKVTEAPADWAGEYVLVCETQTTPYAFTGVDATMGSEAVTITNGVIQNYTGATLTIAALTDGGYSVMVNGGTNDGKYLSSGSSKPTYSNALKFVTTATRVDLAYEDSAVKLYQVVGQDSVVSIRFNANSEQLRFRFYKTGQEPVQLYRLSVADTTGGSDPVTPGAGITYELNGGVTNDYGWCTPDSMFATFMAESGATGFSTLAEYKALADPLGGTGICAKLLNPETCFADSAKWGWLLTYIMSVHAAQAADGASALTAAGAGAAWRYAVGAFFVDGQRASWPKSANFATCGVSTFGAYSAVWKHAFANPTAVTETVTLNEPYKEGFTFDGWYTSADFSGAKVTTIDATTTGTLYAKWIEYIPTIAEVKAMAIDTETKASGVVTFINGKNVYVQDATGGLLLYMNANPTFTVGDKVVVSGMKVMYGGAPELKNGVEVSAEASTLPEAAPYESIASACTEANLFTRVAFKGLKIVSLDSYGNPYVTDGVDTLQCYKMVPDTTVFTVGKKVNLTAILGYYKKYQFVGDVAGFELVRLGAVDSTAYPARGANGEYTLENKWVISVVEDNYEANKPGVTGTVRGMAAKDGIMYFINRTTGSLVPVNGATAEMLDPIKITGEHLFEALDTTDNTYKSAVTLPFNDIKFDGAGNCLIGACISGSQHFMIYKVDITTGAATLLIDEKIVDNDDFATIADDGSRSWGGRFDAFGVYGDVNSDAIVMAADANSFYAYKWTISNGVAGAAEQIDCAPDPASDQSLLIQDGALTVTGFGTAPQIFPVDESYFYVDGWSTLPMLYDMDGMLAEDFITSPNGVNVVNNAGDTCKMNQGHNGICEFQVGDDYFMVMAATNTVGKPASAFALYKFADESKSFAGIEPLWYFPANGMGSATNGFRTAVPSVEVNGTKATIYLYAGDNGYAVYEFTGKEAMGPVEHLYEIGDNQGWKPAEGIEMTKTAENVFTGTFTFTAETSYFAFTTVQSDDWDVVNANRFGGAENNLLVSDGTVAQLAKGGPNGCLTIGAGTFDVTVDLNAMTASFTKHADESAVENTEAGNVTKIVENGQVYVIKNGVRYNVLGTVVEK